MGLLGLVCTVGCVRTYQPLTGLHDPRVVDPRQPNFPGLRLDVYCVPGKSLTAAQAALLCQRVGVLFENQGAAVETFTQDPRVQVGDAGLGGPEADTSAAELVLELRTEAEVESTHPATYALSSITFTLVPLVRETTFTQAVTVRDGSGFLLAQTTLRGRLVERFGAGTWAGNKVLDVLVRPPEEEITGEGSHHDLSADLYGQLSQQVFNARLRHESLRRHAPVRRED